MQIALLSIGDELLHGVRLNTHALFIGQKLLECGYFLNEVLSLPDEKKPLVEALKRLTKKYDVLIITGGLGPTKDDLTREALCAFLKQKCKLDVAQSKQLKQRWKMRFPSVPYPIENQQQAMLIQNAKKLNNPTGAALGMQLKYQNCELFVLPGPPNEMCPMFENSVLPFICAQQTTHKHIEKMMIYGIAESILAHEIELLKISEIQINYCVCLNGVEVFISSDYPCVIETQKKLIFNHFHDHILPMHTLAESLLFQLRRASFSLSIAESCTGGLLGQLITQIAGVSDVFCGGVITYQNELKTALLEVPQTTLNTEGAVSEKCCYQMVKGVMKKLNSSCGIAITGIAGPDGGCNKKPVGTIYIGVGIHEDITVEKYLFRGERIQIQEQSAARAMYNLMIKIKNRS